MQYQNINLKFLAPNGTSVFLIIEIIYLVYEKRHQLALQDQGTSCPRSKRMAEQQETRTILDTYFCYLYFFNHFDWDGFLKLCNSINFGRRGRKKCFVFKLKITAVQSKENLIPFTVLFIFLKQLSDSYTRMQVLVLRY